MLTDEQGNRYAVLMQEIKYRIATIDHVLSGNAKLQTQAVRELCYLELRLICETIALACLVIHGDIRAVNTRKLEKEYSADRLISALGKLYPLFYPKPIVINASRVIAPSPDAHLTKRELVALYNTVGAELHRGPLAALSSRKRQPPGFDKIVDWRNQIVSLLELHSIVLSGSQYMCIIEMEINNPDPITWYLMERIP